MRKIILAAALLLPVSAVADEAAHPISWWRAHPAELRRIIPICQDNSQLANTATCVNAEAAAAGLHARNTPNLAAMLADPRYWSANTFARDAELVNCRNGSSMYPADCVAAAQSALQDLQRKAAR